MDNIETELEAGRAFILPTETVYGIFAKALDQEAVDYIYELIPMFLGEPVYGNQLYPILNESSLAPCHSPEE